MGKKETSTQRKRRLEKQKLKRLEKLANESDDAKRQRLSKRRAKYRLSKAKQRMQRLRAAKQEIRQHLSEIQETVSIEQGAVLLSNLRVHKSQIRADETPEPSNEDRLLSKRRQSKGSIRSRKRQSDDNKEEHDGERVGPPVRRSTRISVRSKPSSEERLPFPSPIQLRVHGVMKAEYKTEPDDGQPTSENDPLEAGSWCHHQCEQPPTVEETQTLLKTEPADDEYLQDLKPDPFELESRAAALEETSDLAERTEIEMKFECMDEIMNVRRDSSIFDPKHVDIKPEPPE